MLLFRSRNHEPAAPLVPMASATPAHRKHVSTTSAEFILHGCRAHVENCMNAATTSYERGAPAAGETSTATQVRQERTGTRSTATARTAPAITRFKPDGIALEQHG